MNTNFKISNKVIFQDSPCLIIAEIGINHMGDVKLCEEMIISALNSGADCVKLQTVKVEESYHPKTESYRVFKEAELNNEEIKHLMQVAKNNNGFLFSTPGDFTSLQLLEQVNIESYKISSGLLSNLPLINEISKTSKPIILSTGMATLEDIDKIALLHCVSIYPAKNEFLNLQFINFLSQKYNVIAGYSDHSIGSLACISAVSSGAKIIEKHFTTNNNIPGADNALSMEPESFSSMCKSIRDVEKMIYGSTLKPHPLETTIKNSRYRKVVASKDIKKGDQINLSNVYFMRIDDSLEAVDASNWSLLSGRQCSQNIQKYTPITMQSIA